jgi:hypothetical protein
MICVNVTVIEDGIVEMEETLQLHLSSEDPAILLVEPFVAEITINNSDSKQSL